MATRLKTSNEAVPHPGRRSLVAGMLNRIGNALRWLLLSLLFSMIVECAGMVLWWPEAGLQHSRQMLSKEIEYLDNDLRLSVLSSDPGRFARNIAKQSHYLLFEITGAVRLIEWLSRLPTTGETGVRRNLHQLYMPIAKFVTAAIQIVQVFFVRLVILSLAIPIFMLFSLIGLVDGLVQRDLRRWGGGRESSYVYHYAKKSIWIFVLSAWVSYLALPFSLHPVYIVLPFAIMFAISISITASTFKKYL